MYKEHLNNLVCLSKDMHAKILPEYCRARVFKLEYRLHQLKTGTSWERRGTPWFRVPHPKLSEHVKRLEVHIPIPRNIDHWIVQTAPGLLRSCDGLQRLFVDNAQYRDSPLWQSRFDNLTHLEIVFRLEECLGAYVQSGLAGLPQNARILLSPRGGRPPKIVVHGCQGGCHGTCGPLLDRIITSMIVVRP
jgi:hypothetical protein